MMFSVFNITDVFASTDTFDRSEDNNYLIKKEYNIDDKMLKSILSTPAVDATEKIYDFADLYTADEEKELYSMVSKYIEQLIVILNRQLKLMHRIFMIIMILVLILIIVEYYS